MASLDVDSLFTNIPLDETIDIVTQKVYGNGELVNGLLKSDLKDCLSSQRKEQFSTLTDVITDRKMVWLWDPL